MSRLTRLQDRQCRQQADRSPRWSAAAISPSRYQHPLDAKTHMALQNTAGLEDLVRLLNKHLNERITHVVNVASRVRVDHKQFPNLYELYLGCCERLGVQPTPELYLQQGRLNAFTSGVESPFVVLTDEVVDLCPNSELEFILGHELGHIKHQHLLYHQVAMWAPGMVGTIPLVGDLLSAGLQLAFFEWLRASEYSADRAGLLVCQDVSAVLRVLMKLSGVPVSLYDQMDVEAFLEQARAYENMDSDWMGFAVRKRTEAHLDHPWTVLRAQEIQRWHDSGSYGELLGIQAIPPSDVQSRSDRSASAESPLRCTACATVIPPGDGFCSNCGRSCHEAEHLSFCPLCRAACPPGSAFCESCGHALAAANSGGIGQ